MTRESRSTITYFAQEGIENLQRCMQLSFEAASVIGISRILIFTAKGDGVRLALSEFRPLYPDIKLVAVTFPVGKAFTDGQGNPISISISDETKSDLETNHVPIVRAHLPFDSIAPRYEANGTLGQDLTLVGSALSIFGGSTSLCVQAAMMACDAGVVEDGEHVIVMTSDTSLVIQAAPTLHMLRKMAVRQIICKPAIYTIGRNEELPAPSLGDVVDGGEDDNKLLSSGE